MKKEVVIIDTSCANVASVRFAIERLGYKARISGDLGVIQSAERLLLPGVGSAFAAMQSLKAQGMDEAIAKLTQPLFGICLGMQLLGRVSEEAASGEVKTLGVVDLPTCRLQSAHLPLPHMGWNRIHFGDHPLFEGLRSGCYVYFVHSYAMPIGACSVATCEYGDVFCAAIGQGNFFGAQFHPEKSGKIGARILQNFIENCCP